MVKFILSGWDTDSIAWAAWRDDDSAESGRPGAAPGQIFLDLMTETTFAVPSKALASTIARAGGRAFLYRFDWQSPAAALGACHCLDIPFALGTWRAWMDAPIMAGADEAAVEELSADMMQRWAEFAMTGDPGFPAVRADARPIMVFDWVSRVVGSDR